MEGYNRKLGKYGEDLAADYLRRQGLEVIGRNYNTRYGEIDLIARNGDEVLFVEVKTRTSAAYGHPEQAVDWRKVRHLARAIGEYLHEKRLSVYWRLDVISIEIDKIKKTAKIRWFKDVTG